MADAARRVLGCVNRVLRSDPCISQGNEMPAWAKKSGRQIDATDGSIDHRAGNAFDVLRRRANDQRCRYRGIVGGNIRLKPP